MGRFFGLCATGIWYPLMIVTPDISIYYIKIKAKLRDQEGLPLDTRVNCEAKPHHTADTQGGQLPSPHSARTPASRVDQVPCQSADQRKGKVLRPEGAATMNQETSTYMISGTDQHCSRVTAHIVLQQAEQEDMPTSRTERRQPNHSIGAEPQNQPTPQWTPSVHPPP